MHRAKQVWHRIRSFAGKIWQRTRLLTVKLVKLPRKISSGPGHDPIPPLGILLGALAFGFWWQSFAAALFGCILLFFLAGIYKSGEQIAAAVHATRFEPHLSHLANQFPQEEPEDSNAFKDAVGCLKPWLVNEVQLTEEKAKECCAVLLDSVASKARRLTNT